MRTQWRSAGIGSWIYGVLLLFVCPLAPAQIPGGYWIDAAAYGEFHVVLPDDASPEIESAAHFFKKFWEAATDREISMGPENEGLVNVWLGSHGVDAGLLRANELDGLSEDGILIKTYTPARRFANQGAVKQLLLAGGSEHGVHHSASSFLEQQLGIRFLSPDQSTIPRARFTMNELQYRYQPPFAYRELGYHGAWRGEDARAHRRALRLPETWAPGPWPLYNLYDILPPEEYAHLYREVDDAEAGTWAWWLLDTLTAPSGGKRLDLCLDDPLVAEAMVGALSTLLHGDTPEADSPEAARRARILTPGPTPVISIVPMPWSGKGVCGESEQSLSDGLLTLMERVEDGLREIFPDQVFHFHSLAEGPFRAAPSHATLSENGIIQVSTRDLDGARAMRDPASPHNTAFWQDLEGWSRQTQALYILDYSASFRNPFQAHPNFEHFQTRYQHFDQAGVRGVYAYTLPGTVLPLGEWDILRAYFLGKLLWDPDYPVVMAIEEFMEGYYGPAAPEMKAFLATTRRAHQRSDQPLTALAEPWWDEAWLQESQELFAQALARDLEAPYLMRVESARLPLDYAHMLAQARHSAADNTLRQDFVAKVRKVNGDRGGLAPVIHQIDKELEAIRAAGKKQPAPENP